MYDYLYNEIVSNRLTPGSALSELEISKKLQTSRSPVREATMVLESEGLVRRYPGRGCFVSDITAQDINEIFELRIMLEVEGLRKSYHLIDMQKLELLEQSLLALTPEDSSDVYYETDRRLHEMIVSGCGNMRLMLILHTLNGQIEQLRRISARQPLRLRASRQEHLDLVSSIKTQDVEHTCAVLSSHIRNVQNSTLNVCMQMGISDVHTPR